MKKIYVTIKNTPIFLRLSLIIIVVFIFISVSFFITSKNYREERLTSIYNIVNQNNHQNLSKIDDYIEDIANITKIPLTYKQLDKNYMNFLYEFSINGTNSYDFQRLNEQIFEEIFTYKESVNSCFIFNLAGVGDYKVRHAIYQPFNPSSEPWFSDCLDAFGKPVLIDTYELPNIVNDKLKPYYVFGIARGIVRLQDASVVGILLVNTDISFFKNICENMMLTDNHRVIILHDGYTIYDTISENISMPASEEINSIPVNTGNNMFSLTIDDESMFAASLVSDNSNWQIISLIPESELFYELNLIQNQNIEMIIIAITISLILLFLISRQIVNPIQRLSKVMKIAESGDFHAHVQVDRMDETGMLAVSYNSLLDKINELIEEVYMQQISSSKLELQMLQSQINPHFLYNTLESISMMATLHDDEITAEMSATLGDILRYSISNLNQPVTLNDEITQMKKYISLLERRFHSQYP